MFCINSICLYFYLKHSDQDEYREPCLLKVGKFLPLLSVEHFLLSFGRLAQHFLLLWHLSQNMECCFLHHTNFVLFLLVPSTNTSTSQVNMMKAQTCLFSKSILFPSTTKGKLSGSPGLACIRNSSLQLSNVRNELLLVTSNTNTQQSAPL